MKTKKSKLLKTISFSSLALLMGIAGTMAFAPLGANPNTLATASETEYTTEQGLITPKADDPTLYTTESGLDIKFGLATPNIEASLATGNLKGFPYFTTTSGGTTYTWVIIGQAKDKPLGTSKPTSFSFSSWTSLSDSYTNKKYYNENIKDTTTPAGSAINAASLSKSYVIDYSNFGNIKTNSEIPNGCVLVLANGCVTTDVYNTSYSYNQSHYRMGAYRNDQNTNFKVAMQGYYTNKSLGLSNLIDNNQIQSITLKTYEYQWSPQIWAWRLEEMNSQYIFPLCASSNGSNFTWSNYLTADQMKLSINQWVRGNTSENNLCYGNAAWPDTLYYHATYVNTDGVNSDSYTNFSYGYRPAFVLKIT